MSNEDKDPLAAFRGDISKSVSSQINPAAFRQISQSATPDRMSGDPHHYDAFVPSGHTQERLKIRRVLGERQSPSYRYLMNILSDDEFGTRITLVYSFMEVKIEGKNLQLVMEAVEDGTCALIQEYHANEFTPPATDAPVITRITFVGREEKDGRTVGKEKPEGKDGDEAPASVTRKAHMAEKESA